MFEAHTYLRSPPNYKYAFLLHSQTIEVLSVRNAFIFWEINWTNNFSIHLGHFLEKIAFFFLWDIPILRKIATPSLCTATPLMHASTCKKDETLFRWRVQSNSVSISSKVVWKNEFQHLQSFLIVYYTRNRRHTTRSYFTRLILPIDCLRRVIRKNVSILWIRHLCVKIYRMPYCQMIDNFPYFHLRKISPRHRRVSTLDIFSGQRTESENSTY